jgi:hypothetical protein
VTGDSRQSKTGAIWLSGLPGEDEKSSRVATIVLEGGAPSTFWLRPQAAV